MDDHGIAFDLIPQEKCSELYRFAYCLFTSIDATKDGVIFGWLFDYEYMYIVRINSKGEKVVSKKMDYGKQSYLCNGTFARSRRCTLRLVLDRHCREIPVWLIRLDSKGNVKWKTDLTNLSMDYAF